MAFTFPGLCHELSQLQLRVLRREGAPSVYAREAVHLIERHALCIVPTRENIEYIPVFLRSCATLLQHVPHGEVMRAGGSFNCAHTLARAYVFDVKGDVNQASSILQSIMVLSDSERKCTQLLTNECPPPLPSSKAVGENVFDSLLSSAYENAYQKWVQHRRKPVTASVLAMLRGSGRVYGSHFNFSATDAGALGLLPCRAKVEMEAKLQRCNGARELMLYLRTMDLSRVDAGMCVSTMAETGLYDGDVCNRCCEVLHSSHAMLSSSQLSHVLYSLGVLKHRSSYQKFFSSLIDAEQCNAESVRRHVMGLAMLQQPPFLEERLMNGIFMHALRTVRAKRGCDSGRQSSHLSSSQDHPIPQPQSGVSPSVQPSWYLDVAHALSCLSIHHHKFMLMTARQTRRAIGGMSISERCKLLYALGGVSPTDVPEDLKLVWSTKVQRSIAVAASTLRDVAPEEGLRVANALLYCGIREHPSVVSVANASTGDSPLEVLFRTRMSCSKERLLYLTEQIEPTGLGNSRETGARLVSLVTTLAQVYGCSLKDEGYRLGPLCTALGVHCDEMTVDQTLQAIDGLQQVGITYQYSDVVQRLLRNLWRRRHEMVPEERIRCGRTVAPLEHGLTATNLVEFAKSL